jgi:beta-lactam-binding protein with PASTA domain/tRNA A-37 threonylcarbamoyl transferase component Bud32
MIGRLIDGRYQVRSRIARGGMATVYVATDLRLERRVAIKIMHGHLADDEQFKERFIQEARSAARLAHPNVVNVFDQGQDSDMAYLVMEYLPGITLRDLLQEHKTLTSEQTLDILEAVLSGLAAAHKSGIVHRDLKPENVLLADDGRIKIGDFGLARAASANTATGAALLGTIAYLSPELVTRGIADTRSDIYAVGIMMYEMLAGEQPFKGEQPMQIAYQHANDSVPTPSTKNPRVPAELDELVLWATAREPDERPRDARVMLDQLLETQSQLQTALPTAATAVQRTMVLPSAMAQGNNLETQVLRPRQAAALALAENNTGEAPRALAAVAEKRRARGWWLFGLVVLLAALAGGTGWWFGWGPGSTVSIPESVVGMDPDAATRLITERGLTVSEETTEVFDPYTAIGKVSATDPGVGIALPRDTIVTLQISKGPEPKEIPAYVGETEEAATQIFTETGFEVLAEGRVERFSSKIPAGSIISASGFDKDDKRYSLKEGDEYFDRGKIALIVSVGPLPKVEGLSYDDAFKLLAENGLTGKQGDKVYSDTVKQGLVVRVAPTTKDAPINRGDTVLIVTSRGPDLVDVPDVIGESINDAAAQLKEAGFKVEVDSNAPPALWGAAETMYLRDANGNTLDEEGARAKRGSTITIVSNY